MAIADEEEGFEYYNGKQEELDEFLTDNDGKQNALKLFPACCIS